MQAGSKMLLCMKAAIMGSAFFQRMCHTEIILNILVISIFYFLFYETHVTLQGIL